MKFKKKNCLQTAFKQKLFYLKKSEKITIL